MEIFFANELLSASECLALGIVSRVGADGELAGRALALVESLARGPAGSLARIKVLVDGAPERSLQDQFDLEYRFTVGSGRVGARRGRGRWHCCVSPEEAVILWRPPAESARTACGGLAIHFN